MRDGAWNPRWLGEIPWRYTGAEIRADGAVHAIGLTLAVLAFAGFLVMPHGGTAATTATAIYLVTLLLSLTASALYNLWPVSRPKWILRRLDHSAIYLLIAGTYTPFMVMLQAWWLLAVVWSVAAAGIALKLLRVGRYDGLSIGLYLALGWSGITVCGALAQTFPPVTLWLIGIGGAVYSCGVVFHVWERLPFQNAVWHGFVVVGAMLHYGAVWSAIVAMA
ncbi:hemolysin III family protein [Lichenihabitans sp. Uapishka_5]|uniref:PAQR family membrane homeostasis protein TrhA n=1 Tax=Lichenihabitans sp. Uapishka_5 TaxID=3037302 RepID=UPI0029E7D35F|nr:hemolysin III family protein [Lichenihabitans sp. Uapishka_5]MDX7951209.1 hemolysin III family protein [Lichenihabitans sp. Uapishka_5]